MKEVNTMTESSNTRKCNTNIRNTLTRCEKKAMQEVDEDRKQILLDQAKDLKADEESACGEMIAYAKDTELGDCALLVGGLSEFQEALKGFGNANSKRAQDRSLKVHQVSCW